ncbi:MAG: hypothetical protein ACRELB_12995 [Polyangiaceae bacterium]
MRWGISPESQVVLLGVPPWGFGLADDRTGLVVDEGEQKITAVVRHMFACRRMSVRQIVSELEAMGIIGRSGRPLTQTSVFAMLRDGPKSKAKQGRPRKQGTR